ncbi:MAG: GPW/gp25 family protein [Pseudomonadota bacterium]
MNSSDAARIKTPLHLVFFPLPKDAGARKGTLGRQDDPAPGGRTLTGVRGMERYPITEDTLRKEVDRSIVTLLNSVHMEASEDLTEAPHVRTSILNYGMADLAALTIDSDRVGAIPKGLTAALIAFEPRLDPRSIAVARDESVDPTTLTLRFHINAQLKAKPLNIPVAFVAEVDSEFAKFRFRRR